jgi:glutamine amidotransferase-like uncharacterized protein
MPGHKSFGVVHLGSRTCFAIAAFLMVGGLTILSVCYFHQYKRRALEEERLVESLTVSTSRATGGRAPIRVAIFDANSDNGPQTIALTRILGTDPAFEYRVVGPPGIVSGVLAQFDVVIFPGGAGSGQATALGEDGKRGVREFVRGGGGYVGLCAGAFLATANYDWSLGLINAKTLTGAIEVPGEGTASMADRGAATVKMELTVAGARVFKDVPRLLNIEYAGGPILSPADIDDLPDYVTLAYYRTEVWKYEPQRGTMIDTPAVVAARFGKGRVVIFSGHPEVSVQCEPMVIGAVLATARTNVDGKVE